MNAIGSGICTVKMLRGRLDLANSFLTDEVQIVFHKKSKLISFMSIIRTIHAILMTNTSLSMIIQYISRENTKVLYD